MDGDTLMYAVLADGDPARLQADVQLLPISSKSKRFNQFSETDSENRRGHLPYLAIELAGDSTPIRPRDP